MLEGSQIPAEMRMDQLMNRLDSMEGSAGLDSAIPSLEGPDGQAQNPKSFKAMVSIMQAQMMGDAFNNNDDDKKSDPMSSFMSNMAMQNPAMAASMYGQGSNPMMAQMMMQSMLGGDSSSMMSMMGAMNPAMAGMMNNPYGQMQMNPMAQFLQGVPNSGDFIMPVKGRVSSEYGHRHHPIHGHDHFHSGVDIAAPKGSAIRAPWAGRVVHVGYVQGFGDNTVIVAHENQMQADGKIVYSVFGHNDKAFVQTGEVVQAGEIFATVGSEGNSTGPHLHWETRIAPRGVTGTELFHKHISHTVDPMSLTA